MEVIKLQNEEIIVKELIEVIFQVTIKIILDHNPPVSSLRING